MQSFVDARRLMTAVAALALVGSTSLPLAAQPTAKAPPADAKPVSINLEDIAYPHPVSYLPLTLYGQDVRMAYMDVAPTGSGNGRTAVLFHGMNFYGEVWGPTIEVLRGAGFRVIVPDQIGFGRSSKPLIPYTLHDMARNTRAILEKAGVAKVTVIGHSMGGLVATRFATAYPEMATQLVIVNQIGLEDQRARPWRGFDETYKTSLARSYTDIRQNIERYFVKWDPKWEKYITIHYGWTLSGEWPRLAWIRASLQQMVYMDPIMYEWPRVKARTLVIGGEKDGANFPALAKRSADAIPGAQLVLFPNLGHNPHMEAPDVFYPKLLEFLKDAGTSQD